MKKNRIKFVALMLTVIMIVTACAPAATPAAPATPNAPVAGTQETPEPPAALPLIGITVYDYSNVYTSYIRRGIYNYSTDNNLAEFHSVDAQNDPVRQLEQIDTFIAMGVDGLIVMPVDIGATGVMVERAQEADIPIIFVNRTPPTEVLNMWDKVIYVGLPLESSGEMQAEMIVEHWNSGRIVDRNGDGVMQFVTVMGDLGHPDAEARVRGNQRVLEASGIQFEELDRQIANWNTTRARDITEIWLGRWADDIDLVISNNDAMALGVIEAIRAQGLDIPVVGINALPEVHQMIIDGEYFGSVLSDPWKQAQASVDLVLNRIAGRDWFDGNDWGQYYDPVESSVRILDVKITAENIQLAIDAYANCM